MRFEYWGRSFDGFDDPYNTTILNERAVEIPVALDWLPDSGGGLEVGNVLSHYRPGGHRVVDLYEQDAGVENLDVFDIEGRYDWILSISTLEHVRQGEGDPDAPRRAVEHLRSLLNPGGRMLVTIPGGHNPTLDDYLASGAGTCRACTLIRSAGTWIQTATPQFLPYGLTTPWADSCWLGEWKEGR